MFEDLEKEQRLKKGQEKSDEGSGLAYQGDPQQAISLYNEAEDIFRSLNDLHWMTFVRYQKFQALEALERYGEAQSLTEEILSGYLAIKDRRGLIIILIARSNLYLIDRQLEAALENLKLAELLAYRLDNNELKGFLYSRLSACLMEQRDFFTAGEYLQRSLKIYPEDQYPLEHFWCYETLAECYEGMFNFKKAEKFLNYAYRGYSKIKDHSASIEALKGLHRLYTKMGKLKKAGELAAIINGS